MTETQVDSSNNSKQVLTSPDRVEETIAPQPPPKKPKKGIPKPAKIVAAIALVAGVGFGTYRMFFYQPEPDGLFLSEIGRAHV